MSIVIACAGSSRSGSTWQYNVIRNIFIEFTNMKIYSCWIGDRDTHRNADVHIVKLHDYTELIELDDPMVFTSFRDIRNVVGSLCRMNAADGNDFIKIQEIIDSYITNLNKIEEFAIYSMKYEGMISNQLIEIRKIADCLGVVLNENQIARVYDIVDSIKNPKGEAMFGGYDKITLLHPGHIGEEDSNTNSYLSIETQNYISKYYKTWLIDRGYYLQNDRYSK